ncbi:aldolase/citrate lyase family protein [Streptomyces malaysiensis]|uniref:aldolase/citrate lyase family protein n=1 Tax=Streptomyces malaysiensis TaxID=92644 RepID=UPI00142EC2A4|nr:aldolase/citrate lyase family protein [Streptomyces malaysiensis]
MKLEADSLGHARSLLFVPGDRADLFDRAVRSGADAVVIDLEDAVTHDRKPAAREAARSRLTARGRSTRWLYPAVVISEVLRATAEARPRE